MTTPIRLTIALVAFLLLTAAGTGISTKQTLTAAPSSVNLSGVAAAEGTSNAHARADHGHSLSAPTCAAGQALTSTDGTHLTCVSAGGAYTETSVTGDYVALSGDQVLRVTTLSANLAVTLPAAATAGAGKQYVIKDGTGTAGTGQYLVKIAPNGSETIDGYPALVLWENYGWVTVVSNGTSWDILGFGPSAGYMMDLRAVSGLKGWWTASRITVQATIYLVSTIYDLSGNGLTASVAQGSPVIFRSVNGLLDGIKMNASTIGSATSNFSTSSTTFSTAVTGLAIAVSDDWVGNSYRAIAACNAAATGNGFSFGISGAATRELRLEFNGQSNNPARMQWEAYSLGPDKVPSVVTFRGSANSADATIHMDGQQFNMINASARTLGTATGSIYIGQSHFGGSNADQWTGIIHMVAMWDAAVSDANVTLFERASRRLIRGNN